MMPDLEETAAQSQDVMMQTSRGLQRSRQVQCCRSRASELEREREKTEHEDSTQHSADGAPQQLQATAAETAMETKGGAHGRLQPKPWQNSKRGTPACMTEREKVIRTCEGSSV